MTHHRYLTRSQVAEELGVSPKAIDYHVARGSLRRYARGRFLLADVSAFRHARETGRAIVRHPQAQHSKSER